MDSDPIHRQPSSSSQQGERPTRRCAEQVRPSTCQVDHGGKVLDLALHRVRLGVPTVAAAAPSIVDDGECGRQVLTQWQVLGAVIEPASDQDHHGAFVAGLVVSDGGAIG